MMPCNPVVRAAGTGEIKVRAVDPALSAKAFGDPGLERLAADVRAKLVAVMRKLG
jgi:hypothetical protein